MAYYSSSYDSIDLITSSPFQSSDDIVSQPGVEKPKRSPRLIQRVKQWLDKRLPSSLPSPGGSSRFLMEPMSHRKVVHPRTAQSTEEHSKRRFSTKREDVPDIRLLLRESTPPRGVNESWADLSCSSQSSPRTSLTGTELPSSSSTPSSPARFHQMRRSYFRKSISENVECNNKKSLRRLIMVRAKWKSDEPHTQETHSPSSAQERRRHFASSRQSNTPDETSVRSALGEWFIPYNELEFKKTIASSEDVQIFSGRWHGDVVVHEFKYHEAFKSSVGNLLQIRHENILLYMGASIASRENAPSYLIVTNDHGGTSLFNRLRATASDLDKLNRLDVAKKVASAMGYLHAKGIIHGQLTTKNVFISNNKKVHLSLLNYSLGRETQLCGLGFSMEADIFAFGLFVFELFAHPLNQEEIQHTEKLLAELDSLACTDRLKNIIRLCWSPKPAQRPSFIKMVHLFEPEGCLVRRFSTSEPGLDQIN